MRRQQGSDQRFDDLLAGRSTTASTDMERMAKLASALKPATTPAPSDQFKRRLRSELLARAASTPEDVFAAMLDGAPVDAPMQVKRLVAIAAALEPASLPSPDPAFRFQLRNTLIREATTPEPVSFRSWFAGLNERLRRSTRFAGAMAAAVVMMLGSSAALAAAQSALPGDALYGVKRLHESARLLILSGEAEGRARLDLARERLDEIDLLAARGDTREALYISTFDVMDRFTIGGTDLLLAEFERTANDSAIEYVASFAAAQADHLERLIDRLPPGARPAALDSLRVTKQAETRAEAARGGCTCVDDPTFGAPAGSPSVTPRCACEVPATPAVPVGSDDQPGQPTPKADPPKVTDPEDPPRVDVPDDVPDEVEDPVEDLVDDIIKGVEDTLPPLPVPVPTPSLLGGI